MPCPRKTPENSPGISPSHLAMLARKREKWGKNYALVKQAKDNVAKNEFLEKYPKWHELKTQIPEEWRAIIESYYGIDTERLTTTKIGREMPINGKPKTRQAIHETLKKAVERLELLHQKSVIVD